MEILSGNLNNLKDYIDYDNESDENISLNFRQCI